MPPIASIDFASSRSSESNNRVVTPNTNPAPNNSNINMSAEEATIAKKKIEESDLSKSEAVRRAQSHWQFAKSVVATYTAPQDRFKTGESVSLTTAEATFLNMITKSRLDESSNNIVKGRRGPSGRNADDRDVSGRNHLSHLVEAAVAKERLRDAISARLVNLSTAETKFLTKLVANRNVSLEALQNAVHVLDNDPLYNPKLSRNDSEFISDFDIRERHEMQGELLDEVMSDATDTVTTGPANAKMRRNSAINKNMQPQRAARRRAGLDESSIWDLARGAVAAAEDDEDELRDDDPPPPPPPTVIPPVQFGLSQPREMDILSESVRGNDHGNMLDSSIHRTPRGGRSRNRGTAGSNEVGVGEVGLDASTRTSSRRSTLDASMRTKKRRGFERGGSRGSEVVGETGLDASARTNSRRRFDRGGSRGSGRDRSNTIPLDASTRSQRMASTEEKSMWKLVHGESIEIVDDEDSNAVLECKDTGLPVKSVMAGEAMDPLLMACPVERTPVLRNSKFKVPEPPVGHSRDFLSQSVRLRGRSTMMKGGDALSQSVRVNRRAGRGAPTSYNRRASTGDNPFSIPPVVGNGQNGGLAQLLSNSQQTRRQHRRVSFPIEMSPMPAVHETHHDHDDYEGQHPEQDGEKSETVSLVESETSHDVSNPLAACLCGVDSLSLMENCMGNDESITNENEKSPSTDKENEDEDSLASKKRYLHLNKNDSETESDRRTKLSTWMGAPEDYPILGLAKKQMSAMVDGGGTFEDPLEPHVLSPLLMKSLREHLPFALREENFWLRYSLVRDGASLENIFKIMRHSQRTILAIETSDGEVLGSFTSSPWRPNGNNYYGSCEAFVWNLRKSRLNNKGEESSQSLDEYILRESSLDVFRWNAKNGNRNVQLSNEKKLFVGGGDPGLDVEEKVQAGIGGEEREENGSNLQWGMSLALDKELLRGTSSRCATFGSDPLISNRRKISNVFEITNMEIWALTPCMNEKLAEELELGRTFVMGLHSEACQSNSQ